MIVGDTCVVVKTNCCGGHPILGVVSVVKVYSAEENSENIEVYECMPVKNCDVDATMYHCAECLTIIEKENI